MVRHNDPTVNTRRWDGAADAFGELGPPWDEYGKLLLAEDAARLAEQRAAFSQDLDAVARAGQERQEAQEAIERFKQRHVACLMMVLRWAVGDNPSAFAALIAPAFRSELDVTQQAVVDSEDRIEQLEDAVVALESGGGPR